MNNAGKILLASFGLAGVFSAGCIAGHMPDELKFSQPLTRYWFNRVLEKRREHEIKNHTSHLKFPVSVVLINFQAVAFTNRSTNECDEICLDRALMPEVTHEFDTTRLVLDPQAKDLPMLVDAATGLTEEGRIYARDRRLPATSEAVIHEALNNIKPIIGPSLR